MMFQGYLEGDFVAETKTEQEETLWAFQQMIRNAI